MKITDTTIEFPNYTISNHPEGIEINGVFKATKFDAYPPPMKVIVAAKGSNTQTSVNTIDKFPFATDSNSVVIRNLTQSRSYRIYSTGINYVR